MKKISTLLTFLVPALVVAQSYTIVPSNSVDVVAPVDEYTGTQISLNNNFNKPLVLEWELLENNMVNGWDYSLCVYGICYVGVPANGIMDTVPAGGAGFFKMNLTPLSIEGSGNIKFIVHDVADSLSAPDTIVFNYNTTPMGINGSIDAFSAISIFPNPVSEIVYIENVNEPVSVYISDLTGKVVAGLATSGSKSAIPVYHLSGGLYFITIETAGGAKETRKIVINP